MNRVLFTKKHITVSIIIVFTFLLIVSAVWVLGIEPKRTEVRELKTEVMKLKDEITVENARLSEMKNLPNLLQAQPVQEIPVIPNGMQMEDYFRKLEQLDTVLSISIEKMDFEDTLIYPQNEDGLATGNQNQLRSKKIALEILATSSQDLLSAVRELENDTRFTEIEQVIYRCNPASVDEENYAYSASVVLQMYYLSYYETGKAID